MKELISLVDEKLNEYMPVIYPRGYIQGYEIYPYAPGKRLRL